MSHDEERIRTVDDAGDEAMALLRKIDVERAESPAARPALSERFSARILDMVVHALMLVIVVAALFATGEPADATQGPVKVRDVTGAFDGQPVWGPGSIGLETVVTLALFVLAVGISEAVQTRFLGATIGKRRNDVRVLNAKTGEAAGFTRVAVRGALLAIPSAVLMLFWFVSVVLTLAGIGLLVIISLGILRDDRQRGFHDKLAGTEVFSSDVRGG